MAQYLPPEDLKVGNGVETVFGFTFPYLRAADIALTVNDVATPVVLVGTQQISINPAPALGAQIRIYRDTPAQFPAYLFSTGIPMLPKYIDENNRQLLYALQEGLLAFSKVDADSSEALATANLALTLAQAASLATGRAVRAPNTDPVMQPLPNVAARANRIIGFNNDGDPVVVIPVSGDVGDLAMDLADTSNPSLGAGMLGYKGRNVHERLSDFVSVRDFALGAVDGTTVNQAGIEAALAYCVANGTSLYWPAGTYVSNQNLSNLHLVQHWGRGVIRRDATTFAVNPTGSSMQTCQIHVNPLGNNLNDGLTPTLPKASFQSAFDALKNYDTAAGGQWVIEAAAGVYPMYVQNTLNVRSKNRVIIRGPIVGHPNVPTCIVDGGGTGVDYAHGIATDNAYVQVSDILFRNFSGDPSGRTRGALLFDNKTDGYTTNVHVTNCTWFGIYYSRGSGGRQSGGVIQLCRNGVNTDGSKVSVGYGATSLAMGTIIKNCTESGVFWSRGTDGHVDYCTLESNAVGLYIQANSRVDAVSNNFKKNTVGVRALAGQFGNNPTALNNFNIGTADANIQADVEYQAYAMDITAPNTATEMRVAADRTVRTTTGAGTVQLSAPYTLDAGRLRGVGKSMRIVIKGLYTATNGTGITVACGGSSILLAAPPTPTGAFEAEVMLFDVSGGYRWFGSIKHTLSTTRLATSGATGFVSTASSPVTISSTLPGAGDSISIYRTDVYITG